MERATWCFLKMDTFSGGTIALGEAIASATEKGAFSLVGGGDSVSAAKQLDLTPRLVMCLQEEERCLKC